MGRPVVHFEIGCKDSAKTQEFYKKLFDWKIEAMGPAAMIAAEAGGITGHITALGHEPHHYSIFYVDVDDVAGVSPEGEIAWSENPGAPSRASDGDVCMDAGSGGKYCRAVEGKE